MSRLRNSAAQKRLEQKIERIAPANKIWIYYKKLFRRALTESFAAIGFTERTKIIRTLVIWSMTVLFLYSIGWSRIPVIGTENPDASSEVRLGLSGVGAICAIFVLTLAWRLIVLPAQLDAELRREVAVQKAEIEADADSERELLELSALRREGIELYNTIKSPVEDDNYYAWRSAMDAWVKRVKDRLDAGWSVSARHEFDDAGRAGNATRIMRDKEAQSQLERRDWWLLPSYTSRFSALDHLIRSGHYLFKGAAVVSAARSEADEDDDE